VWRWSNDPGVRAASFSPDLIPWEQHVRWFHAKLEDSRCLFFVGTDSTGKPVGQVRCDVNGDEGVLSISLATTFRGRGYGPALIGSAAEEVFRVTPAACVHAYIKEGNEASTRAFLKAGFRLAEPAEFNGRPAGHLLLQKVER
jgi:RimJ/RimL family protein N-acetyltransferase